VLVSVQIGLCVLLVSGAGLLGRTLRNLETRALARPAQPAAVSVGCPQDAPSAERVPALCEDLIARAVDASDGVRLLLTHTHQLSRKRQATRGSRRGTTAVGRRNVFTNMVTPDYFHTFGIGVVGGRVFDA
jgi:hypothetical protein